MAKLNILSLNCHGFNMGTLRYLQDKCVSFDVILLQETWLSNDNSGRLDYISPDFVVMRSSAMEQKLHNDYLVGRPYGGTAVLYNKRLLCSVKRIETNNCRCTAVKLSFKSATDLVVSSVYMPFFTGSVDNKLVYEDTDGCLQSIIDRHLGCNFVFGGDWNVNKMQQNVFCKAVESFCDANGLLWLDPTEGSIDYTYHNVNNGHYKLLDHLIVSPTLVTELKSVSVIIDDINTSDHYAISLSCSTGNTISGSCNVTNKFNKVKFHWEKANLDHYHYCLSHELSKVNIPSPALCCNGECSNSCVASIDSYYHTIVQCLTVSANSTIPVKKTGHQKYWWNDELDALKQSCKEATDLWRSIGCPRSGQVNSNRLQCKYRYKLGIKYAINSADKIFNDELFEYFCSKDDESFWRAWRKRYCSSSVKPVNIMNGKQGDTDVCAEFTR